MHVISDSDVALRLHEFVQSGAAAWFNRVPSMDVGSSIFVANAAAQECGALEMNSCTGNVHDSIFSWNKVRHTALSEHVC